MINRMYPAILEEVGQTLKISRKDLESDIKDIAGYWESCLEKANIKDRDTAIFLLTTCINCYLKGKGIHLANYKSLKKNNGVLVALVTLVPLYVWGQENGNYPKIFDLMPVDVYRNWGKYPKKDIIAQAEEILRYKSEE